MYRKIGRICVCIVDADEGVRDGLMVQFGAQEELFELRPARSMPSLVPPGLNRAAIVIDPAPWGKFDERWLGEVRERAPEALMIVYTHGFDAARLAAALAAGVHGYLLKEHVGAAELRLTADFVARTGGVVADEAILEFFLTNPTRLRLTPMPSPPHSISEREQEVLVGAMALFF